MLSKEELAYYEEKLQSRSKEIEEQIADMEASCEPVSPDVSIGRLTRQDAMQSQQMALHLRERMTLLQTQIKTALERIASDKYGLCVLCKEPIAAKRLELLPEAPLCVACLNKRTSAKL